MNILNSVRDVHRQFPSNTVLTLIQTACEQAVCRYIVRFVLSFNLADCGYNFETSKEMIKYDVLAI